MQAGGGKALWMLASHPQCFHSRRCNLRGCLCLTILLQVWLQEFAWTEEDISQKLAERGSSLAPDSDPRLADTLAKEPLFCFEVGFLECEVSSRTRQSDSSYAPLCMQTAIKALFWSFLCYDYLEVTNSVFTMDEALALYNLKEFKMLWEATLDTKCLVGWNADKVRVRAWSAAHLQPISATQLGCTHATLSIPCLPPLCSLDCDCLSGDCVDGQRGRRPPSLAHPLSCGRWQSAALIVSLLPPCSSFKLELLVFILGKAHRQILAHLPCCFVSCTVRRWCIRALPSPGLRTASTLACWTSSRSCWTRPRR